MLVNSCSVVVKCGCGIFIIPTPDPSAVPLPMSSNHSDSARVLSGLVF